MSKNIEIREGEYGDKVLAFEPGGVEAISEKERHGKPWSLFATWMSPNLEFATIYVGALGVIAFGLNFWQAVIGIVIGNALGSASQFILTQDGPRYGVPQMVLGRAAFGKLGNILPSVLNAGAAGIGWFAVNSISGAYALSAFTSATPRESLAIVVLIQIIVAFIGHNLVQAIEKYLFPFLIIVFSLSSLTVLFSRAAHINHFTHHTAPGGMLILISAVFGYAAGWNPFSSDYSRYLPKSSNAKHAGLAAGLGIFFSATVLEIVGAAAGTAGLHTYDSGNPTGDFTGALSPFLASFVLIGIVGGSICANVLNIYSGSMSFLTIGVKLGSYIRRGLFILVFGFLGYLLAHVAMSNPANNYENFLLIMSYWIGPWLGVVLADKYLRKGKSVEHLLFANRENWAGPISFVIATVISIAGFCNQTWGHGKSFHYFDGWVVNKFPNIGDITFFVGFALAFVLFIVIGGKKVKEEN